MRAVSTVVSSATFAALVAVFRRVLMMGPVAVNGARPWPVRGRPPVAARGFVASAPRARMR